VHGLARNDRDWSQLVALGAISNVVLIDHDGIHDPRLVNDLLLLSLKGIMSEFELARLPQRAHEANRTKAQRGELPMQVPVGFLYRSSVAIELDPDARVPIRLVLQKFDELHSTRQVLLWLRRDHISLLVSRQGKVARETDWAATNYTRVDAIITNPLRGGVVYGRTESRTAIVDSRIRRTSGHALAVDQRQVVIPDHHARYLDWSTYQRHLSLIDANAYMKPSTRATSSAPRRSILGSCARQGGAVSTQKPQNSQTKSLLCGFREFRVDRRG
jgi:hypothetical protein